MRSTLKNVIVLSCIVLFSNTMFAEGLILKSQDMRE